MHVRAFRDSDGDGIGDFAGPDREARLPPGSRRHGHLAAAVLSRRRSRTTATTSPTTPTSTRRTAPCRTSSTFLREAHQRGLRVITELVLNHTSDQHPWFQRARRARPGSRARDFYVWSDTADRYTDARIIFKDFERSNWTWDPEAGAYYWHRFYSHQPDLNFDNPDGPQGDLRRARLLAPAWESTACGSTRCPISTSAREPTARTCRRRTPSCGSCAGGVDDKYPGPDAARRGQPVAGGRGRLFRRRRRVPHGVPLSGDAAAVHGAPDGGSLPDHRHPAADAGDSRDVPVGHVPPEPRRAHARDGDRRGAGLHVPGVRQRSAGADQPGHPPAARAADGQQPPAHRADERAALLAAGHADRVLRRRDRDGRQHLSRRPQRRPHADAVEPGPQRRLLRGQPAAALLAGHHRPGVPLRGAQRRSPAEQPALAALVDEAPDRPAEAVPRVRPRDAPVPLAGEPPRAGVRAPVGDERILVVANLSRFAQAVELDLAEFQGTVPIEMFGRTPFPAIGARAVLGHARARTPSTGSCSRWSRPQDPRDGRPASGTGGLVPGHLAGAGARGTGRSGWRRCCPATSGGAAGFAARRGRSPSVAITEVIPVPVGDDARCC